jgi:adenylosuccinate synthase
VPYDSSAEVRPVYHEFPGWKKDLTGARLEKELPYEFISFVKFIEQETGVPIKIISIGPDRDQTIIR